MATTALNPKAVANLKTTLHAHQSHTSTAPDEPPTALEIETVKDLANLHSIMPELSLEQPSTNTAVTTTLATGLTGQGHERSERVDLPVEGLTLTTTPPTSPPPSPTPISIVTISTLACIHLLSHTLTLTIPPPATTPTHKIRKQETDTSLCSEDDNGGERIDFDSVLPGGGFGSDKGGGLVLDIPREGGGGGGKLNGRGRAESAPVMVDFHDPIKVSLTRLRRNSDLC